MNKITFGLCAILISSAAHAEESPAPVTVAQWCAYEVAANEITSAANKKYELTPESGADWDTRRRKWTDPQFKQLQKKHFGDEEQFFTSWATHSKTKCPH